MNDLSRRILTFGQLIDLVSADQELHRARRANVASSIRTLLKVAGKTPQMPASFVTVRYVFEAMNWVSPESSRKPTSIPSELISTDQTI